MPVVPLAELPKDLKLAARANCEAKIIENMLRQGIVDSPDKVAIRELVVGDQSNAADFTDLDVRTAQTTGMQFWAEDAADLTANTLSSVLAAGEKVPDNKVVGIYGFFDLTPGGSDLTSIRLKRGSDVLDFWQVEHCYAYTEEIGGMTFRVTDFNPVSRSYEYKPYAVIYGQNDSIDIEMCFKTASDKFVGLFALIGERYGDTISKATE